MRASRLITVLVLAPVAVLGQTSALGEARKAGAVEKAGTEAHQRAADAQLDQGEEQKALVPPAAEGSPRAVQGDEGAQPSAKDDNLEVPDTHTVKPGDTLWDLSGRYLNNPWYWPKIWSYNPEISNPHFIYPGHAVRLRAGEGRVDDDDLESPRELEDLSRADMKKPQQIGDGDEVAVVGPYKIGYVAPRTLSASRDSFVTKRELEQSGVIRAAFEDKLLLTVHDRAYARFSDPAKVKVGDSCVIYKTEREVKHPVTGELFGYQSIILGSAKVVAVDNKAATIEIAQAFDPIERGNLLGPWTQKVQRRVARRPNRRELSGVILTTRQDLVAEIGEHHLVFVDKGRADGVEEGNVFTVVRSGDPYGREMNEVMRDPRLPKEDIGQLLVVDAQQNASVALVVRSVRELYVGDRVEMRATEAAGAGGN